MHAFGEVVSKSKSSSADQENVLGGAGNHLCQGHVQALLVEVLLAKPELPTGTGCGAHDWPNPLF